MKRKIVLMLLLLVVSIGIVACSPLTLVQTFTYNAKKAFEVNYPDYWLLPAIFQNKNYTIPLYEYEQAIRVYTNGNLTVAFNIVSTMVFDAFTVEIWNVTSTVNLVGSFNLACRAYTFNANAGTYYGYCFIFHVKVDGQEGLGQFKLDVSLEV